MLKLVSHSPRLNNRLDKVKSFLRDRDLDALIILKPENLTYLTGFRGTTGALVLLPDKAVLVVDPRYGEKAEKEAANVDIIVGRSVLSQVADFFSNKKTGIMGFESSGLTYAEYEEYRQKLTNGKNQPELIPERGIVEALRAVKDSVEITDLKRAAKLADDCLDYLAGTIKPGMSERYIATKAICYLGDHGSEGESFETIVASGENSSMPHVSTTERIIKSGDLIIIDLGAVLNGYHSDITRTFVAGKPDSRQKEMHKAVVTALEKVLNIIHPGLSAGEADEVCRSLLEKTDTGQFLHSLGHGVGLEIHEIPQLGAGSKEELKKGMVFTVEPGLYARGVGGVRIEDMILLDNAPLVLTAYSRDLIEI